VTRPVVWRLDGVLLDVLTELGVTLERVEAGAYVVTLPGDAGRSTLVWFVAGEHGVAVEAFVLHLIDVDDLAAVHRWLLVRNLRLRAVHFGLDDVGDVFLTGSLAHAAVDVATVDQVLGEVAGLAAEGVPALLRLAYGDRLASDEALAAKVLADGAGRRPAGTPAHAPRRDVRR
jgi:hypothetical protein